MKFQIHLFVIDLITDPTAKQNQIDVITRTQNNQITYMKYKIDSLKVELSNYQMAFDEYKRENPPK